MPASARCAGAVFPPAAVVALIRAQGVALVEARTWPGWVGIPALVGLRGWIELRSLRGICPSQMKPVQPSLLLLPGLALRGLPGVEPVVVIPAPLPGAVAVVLLVRVVCHTLGRQPSWLRSSHRRTGSTALAPAVYRWSGRTWRYRCVPGHNMDISSHTLLTVIVRSLGMNCKGLCLPKAP